MNRWNTNRVKKISIIISALMLMLLLCGCRTRVTNNTDVSQTLQDDGMLQESYQVRRDELGIPVAETPLFTGWDSGSDEYDDYDDYYDDEFDEFDEFDEELDEEEDDTVEERRNNDTSTSPATRTQPQPVRRPAQTTPEMIKVSFDVNAKSARCTTTYILIQKGGTYGTLPVPTRDGYNFKGWYTAKKNGSEVTSSTKLKSDKEHTLYAHWSKAEKKTYTVTFDGNGEDDEVTLSNTEMTVEEGGKYGDMPSAKRKKYTFSGWFTEPEGGSQVTGGSKFTGNEDQTLYAHWEYDPYTWWDGEYKTASNVIEDDMRVDCIIDGGDDTEDDFVKACKGKTGGEDSSAGVIIKFVKNYDEETAATEAEDMAKRYSGIAPGARIVVISDKALKGSKEQQLLYKMMLFDVLYGSGKDDGNSVDPDDTNSINEATTDLLDADTTVDYPYIYTGVIQGDPSGEPAEEVIDESDDPDDSTVEIVDVTPDDTSTEQSGEPSGEQPVEQSGDSSGTQS